MGLLSEKRGQFPLFLACAARVGNFRPIASIQRFPLRPFALSSAEFRHPVCIPGGMPEVPMKLASAKVSKSIAEKASPNPSSATSSSSSPARRPGAKTKWLLSIVGMVAVVAAGIFLWSRPQESSSTASVGTTETTLPLETFIVNLEGAGQRAYLRVGITLGLSRPLKKKEAAPIALVRDTILTVLANAHPDQLLAAGGKQNLKAEIVKALQESAPDLGVDNVYFTEFLVQM